MTTLGRCSWAAREKESHGLLPLYVALVTKAPAEVALAMLEAYPKLLLNGKWQDISARGARSLRRFPPVAARSWLRPRQPELGIFVQHLLNGLAPARLLWSG